jgi:hypothetical protein
MPPFYTWTHVCLAYDGLKDIYKLYVNGEKRESGSWGADNRQVCVGVEAELWIPDLVVYIRNFLDKSDPDLTLFLQNVPKLL